MTLLVLALLSANPILPDEITLKTPTQTFTASHYLALARGQIWWKPNPATGVQKPWELFPPRGIPIGAHAEWPAPPEVEGISADGDNLIAVSNDGRVYYVKLDTQQWQPVWGPKFREGPLYVDLAAGERYAISHRKIPFEDIDGNPHPIIVGVTTLFMTANGGRTLDYTDPWLPPGKRHHICMPMQGAFRAAAMSASASTVFVMDASGRSFTRLNDFDALGLDPVIRYGWNRQRRTSPFNDEVYSLPVPGWVEQPRVPGPTTTAITIFQTGPTNADRELRVGGLDGYWKKAINAPEWEHVTAPPVFGAERVNSRAEAARVVPHTKTLTGTLDGQPVTVEDWTTDCPPATLVIGDARMPLLFLEDWDPKTTVLYGALFDDGHHLPLFHGRELIEVKLNLDGDAVTLTEQFRPQALALKLELIGPPTPKPLHIPVPLGREGPTGAPPPPPVDAGADAAEAAVASPDAAVP